MNIRTWIYSRRYQIRCTLTDAPRTRPTPRHDMKRDMRAHVWVWVSSASSWMQPNASTQAVRRENWKIARTETIQTQSGKHKHVGRNFRVRIIGFPRAGEQPEWAGLRQLIKRKLRGIMSCARAFECVWVCARIAHRKARLCFNNVVKECC